MLTWTCLYTVSLLQGNEGRWSSDGDGTETSSRPQASVSNLTQVRLPGKPQCLAFTPGQFSYYCDTRLMALFPGLPRWAGTRKVKPIWILLKQETVSGSGISWAICKSAYRARQITMPTPHHSSDTGTEMLQGHWAFYIVIDIISKT